MGRPNPRSAAITNTLADAQFYETPLTPRRVRAAIAAAEGE